MAEETNKNVGDADPVGSGGEEKFGRDGEISDRGGDNDGARAHDNDKEHTLPSARLKKTPWRGWVWAVPLAAIILVGFLAVHTWLSSGPTVIVTFPVVHGLNPKGTSVSYKGVQVGTVESVSLSNHDRSVTVTLSMKSSASGLLRSGAQFWIKQPSIFGGDLGRLISGPEIAMLPGKGRKARNFTGLLHRPDLVPNQLGSVFVVNAARMGKLHHGSLVLYHGLHAGKLIGWSYDAIHHNIKLKVFIHAPFNGRVGGETRFWRQPAFGIATKGGFHVKVSPFSTILNGAISFCAVGHGPKTAAPAAFQLYANRQSARHVLTGQSVIFTAEFAGAAGGIKHGCPVLLEGMTVGQVRTVRLKFDARRSRMIVPVTFAIYSNQLGMMMKGQISRAAPTAGALRQVMAQLVRSGLRAQIGSSSPVLGEKEIALVMAGKPGRRILDVAVKMPVIPAISGGGLAGIMTSVSKITHKINKIPLAEIGQNLRRLSARLGALAAAPELKESLAHLNKTLANMQFITQRAKGQIAPTLASFRNAARAAGVMAKTVTHVVGGGPATQQDVQHLVSELTKTARAVRRLANFLDRHPGALLHGRSK